VLESEVSVKTVPAMTVSGTIHKPDVSGAVCRIDVPSPDVARVFGRKGRVPIVATFANGHSFRTSLTPRHGKHILPVNAEMREIAGLTEGESVSVTLSEDCKERTVEVSDDLAAALSATGMREVFDRMSYSHRKEWSRALEDAKRAETRVKRIADCVSAMQQRAATAAARIRSAPRIDATSQEVVEAIRDARRARATR
jgi:hypothetical protein